MFLDEIFPTPIWGFDNMNLDVDSIKFWAYEEKKKDEGRVISNVGGWQSNDYKSFDNTPLQDLVKYALKESHHIAADLGIPKSERVLENLWVNINPKYSYNQAHVHPEARLSGVFYVDAPEKSGDICFSRDNGYALGTVAPELTRYSGVEQHYPAKTNRMLIFPAWVEHHVKPNLSDEDRISISFNIL
tara:strand:+ start:1994 stop:2557 length:564 start_codon:yes stop_codon:yes gene_type:complete